MSNNKYLELTNEVRDEFINGLQENGLQWFANWKPKCISINGKTQVNYRGINHLNLSFDGYSDTRYYTFDQAKALGYKIPKGAKARKVVKFSHYDVENKKLISPLEFDKSNPNHTRFFKYYYVFNAEQLEGIELQPQTAPKFDISIIAKIAKAMGVELKNGTFKAPNYCPKTDEIELPSNSLFKSQKGIIATALHELSHATGHATRLDRQVANHFGSKPYAFEELVAEMSSALLCSYLGIENKVDNNHKAYVNSWIKHLKDEPKALIDAFKLSEQAFEYIVDIAKLDGVCEIEKSKEELPKVVKAKPTTQKKEKVEKEESKQTSKARLIQQAISIENGIEYITWTRNNGQAFIKLAKDFYEKMSKKERARFDKAWLC